MEKRSRRGLGTALAVAVTLGWCNPGNCIVGYVNMNYPSDWSLIANPVDAGQGNNIGTLFGTSFEFGTTLSLWNAGYSTYTYNDLGDGPDWYDAGLNPVGSTVSMAPGVGAVLYTPATPPTITYVGNIICNLDDPLNPVRIPATPPPAGVYLLGSTFPVASSTFDDIIGRPPNDLDAVLTINTAGDPTIVHFDATNAEWQDSFYAPVAAPSVGLAQSAFFDLTGGMFENWALPVPEPGTLSLLTFAGLTLLRRRR